jgi:hypothetical protein
MLPRSPVMKPLAVCVQPPPLPPQCAGRAPFGQLALRQIGASVVANGSDIKLQHSSNAAPPPKQPASLSPPPPSAVRATVRPLGVAVKLLFSLPVTMCAPPPPSPLSSLLTLQDGLPFGHLALRQVGASVVANRSDIKLLAFWWTNSVHLRGFLQSLNLALEDASGAPTSLHWASEVSALLCVCVVVRCGCA